MYSLDETIRPPEEVGGKAHHLMKLNHFKVTTPKGFVLPTSWSTEPVDNVKAAKITSWVRHLADQTNKGWNGDSGSPLLVSVRSGAPISMPGMMETVLNVGLTRNNLKAFADSRESSAAFANDCYRRLIQMYGTTVMGIEKEAFGKYYDAARIFWLEMTEDAAKRLVDIYEEIYLKETGTDFPSDASVQLLESVAAVFDSWNGDKAKTYRDIEGISHDMGTAVVVQEMVFGNTGQLSGTGVAFSHDPNTGTKGIYGDLLLNAQGEDVVAGTHKTTPIKKLLTNTDLKHCGKRLQSVLTLLFSEYKDIMDIEFTIENGQLWILQARVAKRSRRASIRVCLDMVKDGICSSESATEKIMELIPKHTYSVSCPDDLSCVGKGIGVTEGEVAGRVAIGKETVQQFIDKDEPYVYLAKETAPDDSFQMKHAVGILTAQGGTLSHAALIARSWDKCCVVGFEDLKIDGSKAQIDTMTVQVGDWVKINGSTGEVYL